MNTPKYKIGDYVWRMKNNQAQRGVINAIAYFGRPTLSKNTANYGYLVEEKLQVINESISRWSWEPASQLFPTKEELLKSL